MDNGFAGRLTGRCLTRRDFVWLLSLSTISLAVPGCAVDPVTGKKEFVLMSEADEIALDNKQSPQQFSMDYGPCQDRHLNAYLNRIGQAVAATSHRPDMPYSFRGVNAAYVNAYAFPGGSIAVTRGILVELDNEAELAALLGHEIGHVNARHTAERMTKGTLLQVALAGSSGYLRSGEYASYAPYLETVGGLGATALLASYSRDDEREADRLALEYMVAAGYNPKGMEGLMAVLVEKSKHQPNALELMFSTHPMSQERLATAKGLVAGQYSDKQRLPLQRERFLDNTAAVRQMRPVLLKLQEGSSSMAAKKYSQAEDSFASALKEAPDDYAALLMMAKCKMALNENREAKRYASKAKKIYPGEAQAVQVSGITSLAAKDYDEAYQEFASYDKLLPGNSQITFLKAISLDGMGKRGQAAQQYQKYLQIAPQGDAASHARQRLTSWGYIKQQQSK